MRLFAIALLAASVASAAQPPPLPAGTHSVEETQAAPTAPTTSPKALDVAEDAMVKQDWPGALSLLSKFIATNPAPTELARADYDVGFCDEALDRPDDALTAYTKAVGEDPKQFEAHAALGRLLVANGKSAEGREQLETATHLTPATAGGPSARADVLRSLARLDAQSNPTAASAELIEALKSTPETVGDKLLSAEIAETSGDLTAAEQTYRQTLLSAPDSVQASAGLAHLLIHEKKYSEALPLAEHVHSVVPNDTEVSLLLINLCLEVGDPAKAAELARTAIGSPEGSNRSALYLAWGEACMRQHDYNCAETAYREAAGTAANAADAWSGLAFAATQNHHYSAALEALTMRSKLEQDTPASLFLWATTYDNLRQYKAAMQYYRRFLSLANGGFPDEEFEARHRLLALEKMR